MDRTETFSGLSAFVAAAETCSFTLAGQRLAVSSSAVGKAVARLEQNLGVRLFNRSTRAISLTAEGRLFLARCYRIFDEMEIAREELVQAGGAPRGRLRISLPTVGMSFISAITAFQAHHPEVQLELEFSDRLVSVIEEGFDAVLRIGNVEDSRLMMRRLGAYRHQLVAAPAYLEIMGLPKNPLDLRRHACLRYRYPSTGKLAPWPLIGDDVPQQAELPESATSNTIEALLEMTRAGLGIALLPDFLIRREQQGFNALCTVLDTHVLDRREVSLLWPSGRQQLPKVAAFIQFMAQALGEFTS